MTKLQKKSKTRGDPFSPVLDTRKPDTFHALRYESISQTGSLPRFSGSIRPTTLSSSFPADTNRPANVSPSTATPSAPNLPDRSTGHSPVSPIYDTPTTHHSAPALPVTASFYLSREQQQHISSQQSTSTSSESENVTYPVMPFANLVRPVRVAQDMHDHADPPEYQGQPSGPARRAEQQRHSTAMHQCTKCGKRRESDHESKCSTCGKRRDSTPRVFVENPEAGHTHSALETQQAQHPNRQSMNAASATPAPPAVKPAHTCMKCGKYKRPDMPPTAQASTVPRPATSSHPSPVSRITPLPSSLPRSLQPGIVVEPPSTTTTRAPTMPWSVHNDTTPLINQTSRPVIPRKQSLIRSLSQRLSRKKYQSKQSFSGQGPIADSTVQLIPGEDTRTDERNADPAHLCIDEDADRPDSPFSFVGKADEQEGFQMAEMNKIKSPGLEPPHDYYAQDYFGAATANEPKKEADVEVDDGEKDTFLALPSEDASRPGITRFRSLRNGVSRMSSMSRSSSLRRLDSVRSVGRAFYRDDLAVMEGSEYVAAY